MKKSISIRWGLAVLAIVMSVPLLAQTRRPNDDEEAFRTELRLQGFRFGNFFQTSNPALEEDVNAAGAELRTAFRLSKSNPLDLYAIGNYVNWQKDRLDDSYGGRVGLRANGKVHRFDVYAEQQRNRPSFEVGDVFATADVTNFSGLYSVRVVPSWEIGIDGLHQKQTYDIAENRDNTFDGGDAFVRYRGFGSIFSPEIGYGKGKRDVVDPNEDYDQDEWYVQLRSMPVKPLYLSLRYRERTRDYSTGDILLRNFGREDTRKQWTLGADLRTGQVLTWNAYYSRENVTSTRPGVHFTDDLLMLGLSFGF